MRSAGAACGVRLAMTMGDPRGIGTEICARALGKQSKLMLLTDIRDSIDFLCSHDRSSW